MQTQILIAPDISCDHCERAIKRALGPVSGIRRVEVDIDRQEVHVDFDDRQVNRGEIEAILAREGYPVASEAAKVAPRGGSSCCGSCHL